MVTRVHNLAIPPDFQLEVCKGNLANHSSVNKFGRSTDVDSATDTDIWDGANAADSVVLWVAPTQARVHNIVSTSTSDDGAPVGVGARTIRVYGLTSWSTIETSEEITLNGTTNVATANSYVIIHRMKVLTKGATKVNVGKITATAVTDGTVTAQINVGEGQTQMAIYGISSTTTAYMTAYYASTIKSASAISVSISLLVNPEPDSELINFLIKHTNSLASDGSSYIRHPFAPYFKIAGPAIIKMRANASAANTDVSGGFDMFLVNS